MTGQNLHPLLVFIINKLRSGQQLEEGDLRNARELLNLECVPSEAEVREELVRRGLL